MKVKLNIFIDILAFIVFLFSAVSGIILLGKGSFLGLVRNDWIDVHNISSIIFIVLVIIHLILHWNWIKNIPKMLKS